MSTRTLSLATAVWLALVIAGFVLLGREAYRAAPHVTVQPTFPASSPLVLDKTRLTLLVFAHPQCPCTKATFYNLDQLRAETQDKLAVTIVFTLPPGVPSGWENGALFNGAKKMSAIHIFRDINGLEAHRFGVITSGHVLVYSPKGQLLFSGGITPSRGHAGDSPGELAIVHLTKEHRPTDTVEKPVFGCALF